MKIAQPVRNLALALLAAFACGCGSGAVVPSGGTEEPRTLVFDHEQPVASPDETAAGPLRLVVMDPLSAPLCCACVDGVGQRDYTRLAKRLETALERPVEVVFEESLQLARERVGSGFDLGIGAR